MKLFHFHAIRKSKSHSK